MQYVNARGLNISKLTLGTVQLGMEYGIANKNGKPDITKSFEILSTAVEKGVNSFDTALHYGDSEVVIGKYFTSTGCGTKQPVLTTKFKIRDDSPLNRLEIEKQIFGYIESSLERLNINKIPVYMLHSPQDMTLWGDIVPETLKKAKSEGLIEKAGVSVYTSEDVDEALKSDVYEAVQIPMNVIDNRLIKSGALKRLHNRDYIVFVRSVFLQGLFFARPEDLKGNLRDAKDVLERLNMLADREGMSVAQLALSYIRDLDEITSLVIGAETPEQVLSNVQLLEGPAVSEKTRYEIEKTFDNIPVHILNPSLWNTKE